jgi:hypothetical protein
MTPKPAILLASAITLIGIGVFLWREPAPPSAQEERVGDNGLAAAETQERLLHPSEDNPESVPQLAEIVVAWANADLPRAVQWARQLPDETERQKALVRIGFEAARAEPLTALALAVDLDADAERDELIRHAAGEWAVSAPDAAAEWARRIEDSPLRSGTLARIATAWAEVDPRAAAALAIKELEPGRLQEDTVVGIVQRWAQREPADAATWIDRFEEGELRAAAVQNLVKLWADRNPTEAGEWLKALPPGSTRNLAIAAYAEQIAPDFPQQARQWTELARPNSPQ